MRFEVGHPAIVVGSFDYDLVRADSIHEVVEAVTATSQSALDPERGEFVRHGPHSPSGLIDLAARLAIRKHFRWGLSLHTRAKHARATLADLGLAGKVRRALAALRGHDHPPADDRILPKFWH